MSYITMGDLACCGMGDASDAVITDQWLRPLQSYVVQGDFPGLMSQLQPYINRANQEGLTNTASYLQTISDNLQNPPGPSDPNFSYVKSQITQVFITAGQALNQELATRGVSDQASAAAAQQIAAQQQNLIARIRALQPGGVWNFGDALTAASAQQVSPLQDQWIDISAQIRGATLNNSDRANLLWTQQQIGNALSGSNVQANRAGSSAGNAISITGAIFGAPPQNGADFQNQQKVNQWFDKAKQCASNPASCAELVPWWGWAIGGVAVLGVGAAGYLYITTAAKAAGGAFGAVRANPRKKGSFYVTTYCNKAHDKKSGKPVGHECYVLPVEGIRAEVAGDNDRAIEIFQAWGRGRRTTHKGLR